MFYRSCRFYAPAYRAACFYGQAALVGAAALRVPAIYTATVTDMLHPHLARLPPLQPNQRIAELPSEGPAKFATLAGFLGEFAAAPAQPSPALLPARPIGHDPGLMILNRASGARIMVRCYGDPAHPALMIAHDAPGTGLRAEGLARALSDRFHVIVPDLPGCGESTLAGPDQSVLDEAAASLVSAADALGIAQYAVLGLGCGAAVAARMPRADAARVTNLVLASPPAPNEATAAAIAPALHLSPDGSHWLRAWLMLRDGEIYEPWFNGSVSAQRRTQGNFDAQFLHDQTAALMEGHSTYHVFPRAAWMCDIEAGLRAVSVPVRITTAQAAEIEAILAA
jgi:pimeloyl-ACP methyl ester carboxylesterase